MRITVTLILLSMIISGCNLPNLSAPTPTLDVLGTQVTVKLTAASLATKAPVSTAIPTLSPKTITPVVSLAPTQTPTSAASATSNAAAATSTMTATASTTAPLPSATKTATPTSIPGDPRGTLGKETWKDNFQKPSIWGLDTPYDDGHTRVSISSGKLILTSLEGNNWHGWRMYNAKLQNFYLEVTVQTHDCSGSDQYGVIFRSPDNSKGYWFIVTCDGKYSLESGSIGSSVEIIKAKTSPLILAGSNQTNRLGVMANGNKISLYANGKLLEEVSNDAILEAGVFGYFIAGAKTVNFTYDSTEVIYWKLP
jgi:hypothetical protein